MVTITIFALLVTECLIQSSIVFIMVLWYRRGTPLVLTPVLATPDMPIPYIFLGTLVLLKIYMLDIEVIVLNILTRLSDLETQNT